MATDTKSDWLRDLGLKGVNFKCFEELHGFEEIRPINVIIGRNNSGKSTLIDLVECMFDSTKRGMIRGFRGRTPEVIASVKLTNEFRAKYCSPVPLNPSSFTHSAFATQHLHDTVFDWHLFPAQTNADYDRFVNTVPNLAVGLKSSARDAVIFMHQCFGNRFAKFHFCRISADRDIQPEIMPSKMESEALPVLKSNGENATRLLSMFHAFEQLDLTIVEQKITHHLNLIFKPDAEFDRIFPRQKDNGFWEVNLEEAGKGLIPISQMGSGIKTVLLVLLNLYLVPEVIRYNLQLTRDPHTSLPRKPEPAPRLSKFIFAFEELENNLHPSLQRRLFRYLQQVAADEGCIFFLTTHSHIVIDLFSQDERAHLVHVKHDGVSATANNIATYVNQQRVFDDLDVRASDLL